MINKSFLLKETKNIKIKIKCKNQNNYSKLLLHQRRKKNDQNIINKSFSLKKKHKEYHNLTP